MTAPSPLEDLLKEVRARLPEIDGASGARRGDFYRLTIEKGGSSASAGLRTTVWEDYLASGRRDHCECVDHFFEHLERRLAAGPGAGLRA